MREFTTGEVAKICRVAVRTVCKWFDQGRLAGRVEPVTKNRLIPRDVLVAFLERHGFPTTEVPE